MPVLSGVYAWIGINFVLGRFDHADDGEWRHAELILLVLDIKNRNKTLKVVFSVGLK